MAAFVNEGRIADIFGPGLYTLNTHTLPLLTNLMNWDKAFQSPIKSDVYFFSTRMQVNQKWGTPMPTTMRDKEFGAVRVWWIDRSVHVRLTSNLSGRPAIPRKADDQSLSGLIRKFT